MYLCVYVYKYNLRTSSGLSVVKHNYVCGSVTCGGRKKSQNQRYELFNTHLYVPATKAHNALAMFDVVRSASYTK